MAIRKTKTGPGNTFKSVLIGLVVGIVLGVAGTLVVQDYNYSEKEYERVTAVFERIESKSELASVSQTYSTTEEAKNVNTFFDLFDLPFTQNSFWYRYAGEIKAGVDLSKADFALDDKTITVTLDQPYIISNTPDMDASGVFEERNNILNPIHVEDVDQLKRMCVEHSEEAALEGGLLDQARINAEQDISDMFNAALGSEYTVSFVWREADAEE